MAVAFIFGALFGAIAGVAFAIAISREVRLPW